MPSGHSQTGPARANRKLLARHPHDLPEPLNRWLGMAWNSSTTRIADGNGSRHVPLTIRRWPMRKLLIPLKRVHARMARGQPPTAVCSDSRQPESICRRGRKCRAARAGRAVGRPTGAQHEHFFRLHSDHGWAHRVQRKSAGVDYCVRFTVPANAHHASVQFEALSG